MNHITDRQYKAAQIGIVVTLLIGLIAMFVASPWAAIAVVTIFVFFVSFGVIMKKHEDDQRKLEDQRYENMYKRKR